MQRYLLRQGKLRPNPTGNWVPYVEAEQLRAAMMRVDWHFVLGRLAFGSKPGPDRVAHAQVCRLVEAIEDSGITWTEGEKELDEADEAANRDLGWRWIPMAERTPEETEWCLCYGGGAMTCYAWDAERKRWENWARSVAPGLEPETVTHWMSLPKPPSEVAEAEGVSGVSLEHPGSCDCEECDERRGLVDYGEV